MIARALVRLLAAAAFALVAMPALAATTKIIFVNGIQNNTRSSAWDSVREIQRVLDLSANHGVAKLDFEVLLRYNPDGFTSDSTPAGCNYACQAALLRQDYKELFIQKTAEEHFYGDFPKIVSLYNVISTIDKAAAANVAAYIDKLPGGNSLEPDEKASKELAAQLAPNAVVARGLVSDVKAAGAAIVVAHSQGNLLANLAYAQLASELGDSVRKTVRVVNVANTTRFSVSGLDITHANDGALFSAATRCCLSDRSLETLPSQGANWTRTTPYTQSTADCATNGACNLVLAQATFRGATTPGLLDHEFVATYLSTVDLPEDPSARLTVPLTSGKTRFVDRFEDFIYAAATSLNAESGAGVPFDVYNSLGDRQFCTVSEIALDCSGEQIGYSRGFLPYLPSSQFNKVAFAFDVPQGFSGAVSIVEIPVYLTAGANQVSVSVYRDAGGLPDLASTFVSKTLLESMRPITDYRANPGMTLLVQFDGGAAFLQGGRRYWVEVAAPQSSTSTAALWQFAPGAILTGGVARSKDGAPYALVADQQPAMRVVVTPQ